MSGADPLHMHGVLGLDADGKPGYTPDTPIDLETETFEEKRLHHTGYSFNKRRSDGLPLDRWAKDFQHPQCKVLEKEYHLDELPNTSIIFVMYNEPLSTLLRSIHSVLNTSPPELIHEVIIVDDGSDKAPWLGEQLEKYLALLPKMVLVRMPQRDGLMGARAMGAKVASGDTLTFLDSHIECNYGWLQPLLAYVAKDYHNVAMPFIDSIHADTFEVKAGGLDILGFNWNLGQKGISMRKQEEYLPMPSPIMAGGLFTMDRKHFWDLGGYDPEMKLYGGEEVEISLRIWQCHGTLVALPCSRVAHIYRSNEFWQGQVFSVGYHHIRNKLRAAHVWLDEYKELAISLMPQLPMDMSVGDLSYMQEVRQRHQCKSFKWYLDNVFPELIIPNDPRFVSHSGYIRNPQTNRCWDNLGNSAQGGGISAYPCHSVFRERSAQDFLFTTKSEIRSANGDFNSCADAGSTDNVVIKWDCHQTGGNQLVNYDHELHQIRFGEVSGSKCVTVVDDRLTFARCDPSNKAQEWVFLN